MQYWFEIVEPLLKCYHYPVANNSSILDSLNPKQQEAAKHLEGPALVVAGPGSGKTRVLTYRVAYLIQEYNVHYTNILCVTFTNKAAAEIKERVAHMLTNQANLTWGGTFHSICARILRKEGGKIGIANSYVIYDTGDQADLIKAIQKDFGIDTKKINPKAVLGTISSAKTELVGPREYAELAQGYFQRTVAKIYPEYQKRLRDNKAVDFDDLLVETVRLFEKDPPTLDKYQELFKFIMIDEYQDTNHVQYVFSKMLADKYQNLYVVGDMAQAIYSFRGADYRNILNFQKHYPNAKVYSLEQNYRSTQTILTAATSVINKNDTHIPLELWTEQGMGEKIHIYTAKDQTEEAVFVVTELREQTVAGLEFKDIVVLYRTNAQSRGMEEQLIRANIPYRIIGGLKFYARKEVKDIIAYLRAIHNPSDELSWERIINIPPRGIGPKSMEALKLADWNLKQVSETSGLPFDKWVENKDALATVELIDDILLRTGYIKWLEKSGEDNVSRIENIKELRSVATEFTNLEDFLENVALIESSNKAVYETENQVSLMTIHAAKGLEFPLVFIIGMEEGLFPHNQSLMELDQIEEERRLCYVAITRAKQKVYLTNTLSRVYFGNIQNNLPSRFINEIPQELVNRTGAYGSKGYRSNTNKFDESFLDGLEYDRSNFSW